ncbi:nickel-dependent hydrogenase large subunit, partial [Methylomonas sp. SURF-1]|nr:nickel-dependent hydrogenase large subunit [Methylomonas sp. SURF-1]
IVAERMPADDAALLLHDSDWVVRYTAALKADPAELAALADDPEPDVRELVRQRLQSTSTPEADHD